MIMTYIQEQVESTEHWTHHMN